MSSPSSPLLPKNGTNSPKPLSRTAARALGLSRVLFGGACILAPTFTMRLLFDINVPTGASLLVGYIGVREVVLGELLLMADAAQTRSTDGIGRNAVRTILWGVAALEALDLCVSGVGVARGELGWKGFAWLSGFVVAGFALVGEALWGY